MDSLDLLRDARPGDRAASPESMTAARAALMNAIEAERQGTTAPARHGSRRPRVFGKGWRWALLGTAAAGAATALVLSQAIAPTGTPGAPVSAVAAEFNAVADRASATDASLLPGQYRKVQLTTWQTAWMGLDEKGESFTPISNRSRETIYLPRDLRDDWYWQPGSMDRYSSYTPDGERLLQDEPGSYPTGSASLSKFVFRGPSGVFTRPVQPIVSADLTEAALQRMGTDPAALLDRLRTEAKAEIDPKAEADAAEQTSAIEAPVPGESTFASEVDRSAFESIWYMLSSGVATPAQQATLYRTLALLPTDRVSISTSVEDGVDLTTFTWAANEKASASTTITVETHTGLVRLLEQRSLARHEGVPAGTVMASTAVKSSVVDAAPSGAIDADLKMPDCLNTALGKETPAGYDLCGDPKQTGSRVWSGE